MYSHSSTITHPSWHQRPHVFSLIFNHPSFLTPMPSCILIYLQSPILSDTNVLMYSHSSTIIHPFWHQRPHVSSFIFNHPTFLTLTSSRILIHFQSPILSYTNDLTYCHSSSIIHPFWHKRPNVFSFIYNHPSFLTQTSSCILIHFQSPILSDTNAFMYSHSSSITHPFWHQRPHVFSFIFNHPSFLTTTSWCILIHLQSPILYDTKVLTYSHSFSITYPFWHQHSHSSSITHPFWHKRPNIISFIYNHPSFLAPTYSCILIHFQSPILSDTKTLMYSHSSSITHPFWHQRPHVFSFIFNHPIFLTPTPSCILIHLQSPILSDTNVLMYSHSSSITLPLWQKRPNAFSFIYNHPSFLTATSSCIHIHFQSPILSDTNALMYSHSSSITHPFWEQQSDVFSFIFKHPYFLTPSFTCMLIHLQSPILTDTNVLTYSHSFAITHPFGHQRPHVFSFIFNHPSFLTPTSSRILFHF